jgi:hypothetical protein
MPKHYHSKNRRYTLGFLTSELSDSRVQQMWLGGPWMRGPCP